MKTALVTGASGFIGRELCRYLLELQGWHVRGTFRHGSVIEGVQGVYVDLDHEGGWPDGVAADVDVIFHLAGKAHVTASDWRDEEEYLPVNTASTRKLLLAAQQAGVPRFVYFSTVKVFGDKQSFLRCLDESAPVQPQGSYGISKYMAEKLVMDGAYVAEPVVVRPCMVYGNATRGNLPGMIRAIAGYRFPPVPEFENKRSMVHVEDLVRAAVLLAEHPESSGNVYIVSDGVCYSTRQIYAWICEALGRSTPAWGVPAALLRLLARVGDGLHIMTGHRFLYDSGVLEKLAGSAWYGSEKINRELGFSPRRHLREALPEIVHFLGLGR